MSIDIKTRLVLDSNANQELKKVKSGFDDTAKASKSAASGAADFVKQVGAVALGTHLPAIVHGIKDMATGWLTAANAAYDQEQAIAGLYATAMDMPWDESRKEAEKMRTSLLNMAAEIGQAPDEVMAGFKKMLLFVGNNTKESFEQARKQTEQLTMLANVLGLNVETIAMEFGAMHDGAVRTRGPLFNLLKNTGIFGDDVTKASTEFAKLSAEARKGLLAKALEQQSKKIAAATPTVSDLINTFQNFKQLTIEEIGAPVIRALIPAMKDLKERIKDFRPQIEAFTAAVGGDLAQGVVDGAKWMKEGFQWAIANKNEIRDSLKEGASAIKSAFVTAKDVVEFIIANKEVLAGLYAGAKIGGVKGAAIGAGIGIAASQKGELGAGGNALGTAGAAGGAAAGAALLGASAAVTAALGGLAAAAYQGGQLYSEQWGDMSDEALNAFAKMRVAQEHYNKGEFDSAKRWAEEAAAEGDRGKEIAAELLASIRTREAYELNMEQRLSQALAETNLPKAVDVYNQALLDGNLKMQQQAAATILSSDKLKTALDEGKVKITGGMDALTSAAQISFDDFQASMDEMLANIGEGNDAATHSFIFGGGKKRPGKGDAAERAAARNAAMGGTAINVDKMEIKQEFRDQDPNRIAVIFRRDIVNAAVKRVQSRRATIFGI